MLRLVLMTVLFLSTFNVYTYERIVILSPSAADIVDKLALGDFVVGKTKNVDHFSKAIKVGTHIRPNIELIKSLNPDFIIMTYNLFNRDNFVKSINADFYIYSPSTLKEIVASIEALGAKLGREEKANKIIADLNSMLKSVENVKNKPEIIYEITQIPLTVAGRKSIIYDIIKTAGGKAMFQDNRRFIKISSEMIIKNSPDIYIYQKGPMNKNPDPPEKRDLFNNLNLLVVKVDELTFSRANTTSFLNVLELNKLFLKWGEH